MAKKIITINDAVRTSEHYAILNEGGIVCHPTNTCYGLGCDIRYEQSVQRVYTLKNRKADHPCNILVQSIEQFKCYGLWYNVIGDLIAKHPEHIFTFVVPRTAQLPAYINPNYETIGIQVARGVLSDLFHMYEFPLIATSANESDNSLCYAIQPFLEQIGERIDFCDLIIDGKSLPNRAPSTIIKVTCGNIEILRGSLPTD